MPRNLVLRGLGLPLVGVLAFLLATNQWTAPLVWSQDALSYGVMERAAPGVPGGKVVGSAYAGRWIPHYLVGLFADATGFGHHTAYWIVGIACVVALAVVVAALIRALELPLGIGVLLLLGFVAAPYATPRETLLAPGLLQDEVFVLGLAIALLGLVRVRFGVVVGGMLLALAGRQTALPVLLVAGAWILLDAPWRTVVAETRLRRMEAGTVVVSGLILYAAILAITKPFTYSFGPDGFGDTLLGMWPGAKHAVSHVGRTLIPFVVPGAVLLATWAARWRAGARLADVERRTWLLLAFWLLIMAQPLVISPDYPGFSSNEQRLAGLGLLPLWLAAGLELRTALAAGALRGGDRRVLAVAGVATVAATLSHVYTSIGPSSLAQFVVLQLAAAAVLGGLVLLAARTPARVAA